MLLRGISNKKPTACLQLQGRNRSEATETKRRKRVQESTTDKEVFNGSRGTQGLRSVAFATDSDDQMRQRATRFTRNTGLLISRYPPKLPISAHGLSDDLRRALRVARPSGRQKLSLAAKRIASASVTERRLGPLGISELLWYSEQRDCAVHSDRLPTCHVISASPQLMTRTEQSGSFWKCGRPIWLWPLSADRRSRRRVLGIWLAVWHRGQKWRSR